MEESDTVNTRVSRTIEACKRFLESMTNKAAASTKDMPSKQDKHSKSDTITDKDTSSTEDMTSDEAQSNKDLSSDETPKQASQSEQNSASEMSEKKGGCVGVTRPVDSDHYSSIAPRIKLPLHPESNCQSWYFQGDITMFQSFWDSFQSAVNNNPSLPKIDKLIT